MIVKVGVIGIGTVSQLMHLPILSGLHEQYQITAVSDICLLYTSPSPRD